MTMMVMMMMMMATDRYFVDPAVIGDALHFAPEISPPDNPPRTILSDISPSHSASRPADPHS